MAAASFPEYLLRKRILVVSAGLFAVLKGGMLVALRMALVEGVVADTEKIYSVVYMFLLLLAVELVFVVFVEVVVVVAFLQEVLLGSLWTALVEGVVGMETALFLLLAPFVVGIEVFYTIPLMTPILVLSIGFVLCLLDLTAEGRKEAFWKRSLPGAYSLVADTVVGKLVLMMAQVKTLTAREEEAEEQAFW